MCVGGEGGREGGEVSHTLGIHVSLCCSPMSPAKRGVLLDSVRVAMCVGVQSFLCM